MEGEGVLCMRRFRSSRAYTRLLDILATAPTHMLLLLSVVMDCGGQVDARFREHRLHGARHGRVRDHHLYSWLRAGGAEAEVYASALKTGAQINRAARMEPFT